MRATVLLINVVYMAQAVYMTGECWFTATFYEVIITIKLDQRDNLGRNLMIIWSEGTSLMKITVYFGFLIAQLGLRSLAGWSTVVGLGYPGYVWIRHWSTQNGWCLYLRKYSTSRLIYFSVPGGWHKSEIFTLCENERHLSSCAGTRK